MIGAGPAGLQWGTLLHNHPGLRNEDYLIVEAANGPAPFFRWYPRGGKLISINKCRVGKGKSAEFRLRHDWHSILEANASFCDYNSRDLYPPTGSFVEYAEAVAAPLNVEYNSPVLRVGVTREGMHTVHLKDGRSLSCRNLIIATGARMREVGPEVLSSTSKNSAIFTYANFPPIGQEGMAPFCEDERVTVMGSGNAAFETADLLSTCASAVYLSIRKAPRFSSLSHYPGDVRWWNFGIANRYLQKSLDSIISLEGFGRKTSNANKSVDELTEQERLEEDEAVAKVSGTVVYAGGFTTQRRGLVTDMDVQGQSKGRYPRVRTFWEDRGVDRKWYAGALMHAQDYRRSAGGFIHGYRYLVRAQFKFFMQRHHGVPWPRHTFEHPKPLFEHVVDRVRNASGIYQMSTQLWDVIVPVVSPAGLPVWEYLEEVPIRWIREALRITEAEADGLVVTVVGFQYEAEKEPWPFELMFQKERQGKFLHPTIMATRLPFDEDNHTNSVVSAWNLDEDVFAEWESDLFRRQIRAVTRRALKNCTSLNLHRSRRPW